MLSKFFDKRIQTIQIPKPIEALGIYVICATVCYIILITILGGFYIPVFLDDFNRSIIFLTAILAVIYYKEDLKDVLLICFVGPLVTNILAIIPAVLIWLETPPEQIGIDIMKFFTFSSVYIMYAGFLGIVIYAIAVWLSGFLSVHSLAHPSTLKRNVFSVLDKRAQIDDPPLTREISNKVDKPHTKYQVIGFFISILILLSLTTLLLLLPVYSYSFDLHLTIWDLGLIPVFLVSLVIIGLLSIILVTLAWNFYPQLIEKYPSSLIGIQSKLAAISIFFTSIFFPNPSSIRVGTFVVKNSIGIEILFYVIILIIIFTPSICEYLQPLKSLGYQSEKRSSSTLTNSL
ncbi:MAG: hypothetical protein JSW11_16250 [Candidatus Heimdallarchaeota archaeon]|nr:MAG: hypothetical protein JSW11_16250 [Candidatus Heimdallarchaeota archaeon]